MKFILPILLCIVCLSDKLNPLLAQSIESVKREQRKKQKLQKLYPDFFGFQYKPIVPIDAFGAGPQTVVDEDNIHSSVVTQKFSYSIGGVMRIGFTPRLAIETGINFTRRNYFTEYTIPDSNLTASTLIRNVSYDIPVNLLIYAKVSNTIYINASFGNSFIFIPTNTATQTNTLPHNFMMESARTNWMNFALNANTGVEFRTESNGIFYLGASFFRPFFPMYTVRSIYRYINDPHSGIGRLTGTHFTLDLKYFFPIVKSKGAPIKAGIVDQ